MQCLFIAMQLVVWIGESTNFASLAVYILLLTIELHNIFSYRSQWKEMNYSSACISIRLNSVTFRWLIFVINIFNSQIPILSFFCSYKCIPFTSSHAGQYIYIEREGLCNTNSVYLFLIKHFIR